MNPSEPAKPAVTPPIAAKEHTSSSVDRDGAPLGAATRRPIPVRVRAYRLLWMIAVIIFVLDQATKFWIVARVPFNPMHAHDGVSDIEVIGGFFYIIHVGNTGAAWSMFSGQSVALAVLAAATLIAIFFWRHALGLKNRLTQVCFGLLCGGIVGNLLDRLLHKHVIDFIDLHFGSYIYPTFNVADSAICVGVILYMAQSLWAPGENAKRQAPISREPSNTRNPPES